MDSINTKTAQYFEQEEIIVQPKAPWLQTNGQHTPDEHLKMLTPSWSAATWEKYLKWYEDLEGQRAESVVPPKKYDDICNNLEESIFVYAESSSNQDLRELVGEYLKSLSNKQQLVLNMIFWKGRSERYVAKSLKMDPASVHRTKIRALNKIKDLAKKVSSSRIMRGEDFIFLISKGEENGKQPSNIEDPFAKEAC